ncbi:ClbS/DfsB family four-helix bundle protein [Leuconostoc fallax]|uniref:ClbS/DfsB family four-helix bundle protein n=1 Tax=Leuconostoc fallax TaxID=1251 RepID=UPI0020900429|nr:ClbS/DfsB family four-helix bundle protein [Leuconostoc fallax]MCO6183496.1 ClbS/DfsB family four-helix bundle protein [Leuconostoc fallax]
MQSYSNKDELIQAIQTSYQKYIEEFKNIPNDLKDKRVETVDRTPAENLAYQIGWITALLNWENDEMAGKEVFVPAKGYKWNNLGGLYQSFYQTYSDHSLPELIDLLTLRVTELCNLVEKLPADILFEPNHRRWATTNAQWPVWKWVHINSVAPFKTFRTKIRKWKKAVI